MLVSKSLPPNVRRQRTKTGCISCREARKKCCERKPECTRCSLKGLSCTYEVVEPKRSKTTKRTSPSFKKARNMFAGRELKPEEGFIHTFAVTKPIPSRPPEETIDLTVSPQLDVNSCNMDLDESMELFDTFGNSSESEVCSILTNSIFDDSVSARSGSVDPMSLSLELPFSIFSDLTTDSQSRKLLHHFCSTLSPLIVFVEQPHNSFQDLILPLAYDNSPVFYAICAFACGHLEHTGVYESRHSSEYRALAAKGAFELVQWKCQHEEVLATVMLLAYYEALTSSNAPDMFVGHLKAAFLVISSIPESERSTAVCFLEKAFHYYDVISSLSLGMSPVSAVSVSDYTYPLAVMTSSKPNDTTHADPFMGLVGDLWPVLYRLSIAMSLKEDLEAAVAANQGTKAAVLRVEYESITKSTEKALQSWQPSVDPSNILMSLEEDGNAQHQHLEAMVHNAQAYRHSALVYLHRTVYGYPISHPEVQKNTHLSLESCMAVIASGGPANALLWPLYVAACEAVTDHDQGLAKSVFLEIGRRQGMVNIEQAQGTVLQRWAGGSGNGLTGPLQSAIQATQLAISIETVNVTRSIGDEVTTTRSELNAKLDNLQQASTDCDLAIEGKLSDGFSQLSLSLDTFVPQAQQHMEASSLHFTPSHRYGANSINMKFFREVARALPGMTEWYGNELHTAIIQKNEMVKNFWFDNNNWKKSLDRLSNLMAPVLDGNLDVPEDFKSMAVRMATFEALSIHHTCCVRYGVRRDIDDEDIQEFLEEDSRAIEILHELLPEFEAKLVEMSCSFSEFLRTYWKERMAQVLEELNEPQPLTKDNLREIKRLGVDLRVEDEDVDKAGSECGLFEFYMAYLDGIME
ncbi:L-arabinose-responsive transcription regulator ARA1 [Colletotrichum fructicola]|nr:L-arabinose-responsive transcription regulator ARA1 [Colletotrichum fructicola]